MKACPCTQHVNFFQSYFINFPKNYQKIIFIAIVLNPNTTKRMNEEWGRVAPQAFIYWGIARDPCVVSTKLRKAYFNGQAIGPKTTTELTNLYSHIGFHYPARKVGIKHAKFAPVYFYNFTREVKRSFVDLYGYYKYTNPSKKNSYIIYLFNYLKKIKMIPCSN